MRSDSQGVGMALAGLALVLILLPFAPLALPLAAYFRFRDWRDARAELQSGVAV
jgi:hypothetical protein